MSRFCGECGAEHKPTQKFCQSCGASLSGGASSSATFSSPKPPQAEPQRKTRTSEDFVCPRCRGKEYYSEGKGDERKDYCHACDSEMQLTPEKARKVRIQTLSILGAWVVTGLLVVGTVVWIFVENERSKAQAEQERQEWAESLFEEEEEPEPEPEPEETYRYADNPEACDAMLDANDLFLDSWEGIQNQSIPQDELVSNLEEGAAVLDSAYPRVAEGEMYWWMVSQANNLAIAASSFSSGDTAVTSEALAAYGNDIVDYEKFCQ